MPRLLTFFTFAALLSVAALLSPLPAAAQDQPPDTRAKARKNAPKKTGRAAKAQNRGQTKSPASSKAPRGVITLPPLCSLMAPKRRHPATVSVDVARERFDHWNEAFTGRLGMRVVALSPAVRTALGAPPTAGLRVSRVMPRSLAAKAGLKRGDVVIDIAGKTLRTEADVKAASEHANVGDLLTIQLVRKKKPATLYVTLPPSPAPASPAPASTAPASTAPVAAGRLRFASDAPEPPKVGARLRRHAARIRKLRILRARLRQWPRQ